MGVYSWRDRRVVYVGDTAPAIECVFLKSNGRDVINLTGYSAWFTFWHSGSAPHVVRAATVIGTEGIAFYELQGDEYDAEDEYGIFYQATVMYPSISGSPGQWYFEKSFQPVLRIVKRRPT